MHIVRHLGSILNHFNGVSTQELRSRLAAAQLRLQHLHSSRRGFAFDVKNMFTELPHAAICDAGPRSLTRCFAGFRYVDDGVIVICAETHATYAAIKAAVYAAYPTGMVCEETAAGNVIDILEHRIGIDQQHIHLLFRPKSFPALLMNTALPRLPYFLRVVRTGRVYLRAWTMGTCARLRDNTSATLNGLLNAVGFLAVWLEVEHLGYSTTATRRAILAY
eukprot:jgi/Ulvmu1/1745/UM117_0022.1